MKTNHQKISFAPNQRITISRKDLLPLVTNALQLSPLAGAEKYAPDVAQFLASAFCRKEITTVALCNLFKDKFPDLSQISDHFFQQLTLLQAYSDKLHCNQYDLIREVIEKHPNASFDSKCRLIQRLLTHEEDRYQTSMNTLRDICMTVILSAVGLLCTAKLTDCRKASVEQTEKTKRCYYMTHPFQK